MAIKTRLNTNLDTFVIELYYKSTVKTEDIMPKRVYKKL
ncbi:hypothetical protein SAMN05444355_10520 [Flavobacterium frigoris]|uniref:Uncharacterized protein n=1 Tax=Flavobacterium frigoris TaxID=229204 RepID=A0A1H9JPU1_FLAFI|nr:hypothetical protein SAMN05444355_10520 [Flavobacterium frigoris]